MCSAAFFFMVFQVASIVFTCLKLFGFRLVSSLDKLKVIRLSIGFITWQVVNLVLFVVESLVVWIFRLFFVNSHGSERVHSSPIMFDLYKILHFSFGIAIDVLNISWLLLNLFIGYQHVLRSGRAWDSMVFANLT